MANENDAREAALGYLDAKSHFVGQSTLIEMAYDRGRDDARAECERKLEQETDRLTKFADELNDRAEKAEARVTELSDGKRYWADRAQELGAALATAREQNATMRLLVDNALAYLTDKEDTESTPMHAIGHAVFELQAARKAALASAPATEAGPASTITTLHSALQRAEDLAQSWRDRAFDSPHMSKLKSDTLEQCAAELDAIIATAAPAPDVHIAVSPEAVDECLADNPPPRAECAAEERAVLDAIPDRIDELRWLRTQVYGTPWARFVDMLLARRAAKKGT